MNGNDTAVKTAISAVRSASDSNTLPTYSTMILPSRGWYSVLRPSWSDRIGSGRRTAAIFTESAIVVAALVSLLLALARLFGNRINQICVMPWGQIAASPSLYLWWV
jgi:hypothetical protein